uniref:Nuclear respiratory factor 1 NLS/DNA-binding dimerisation domain-containing protein n=1 Tax=Branchiostoma floridae TaxID=7739 RepID=C3XVQ1_BRAFL|eukprot:XP_002611835.1 hypothetical protein BRAFLDRAFT_83141 [Branchiostoma floridae]
MTEHMTVRNFRKWTSLEKRASALVEGGNDVVILACVPDKNTHQPRFVHWGTACLREALLDHLPAIMDGFHAKRPSGQQSNLEPARTVGEETESATPDLPDLRKEVCGLEVMNMEGLRALVRTAIRITTKREPRWGKDGARWQFWDPDVSYTLSVDPRTPEQKKTRSWASFLRGTLRGCYQHYGLEHLLADTQPIATHDDQDTTGENVQHTTGENVQDTTGENGQDTTGENGQHTTGENGQDTTGDVTCPPPKAASSRSVKRILRQPARCRKRVARASHSIPPSMPSVPPTTAPAAETSPRRTSRTRKRTRKLDL